MIRSINNNLLALPVISRRVSFVSAILFCVLPPPGYSNISYQHNVDKLKLSAVLISHTISKFTYLVPQN
jgi:hypothetical protein